MILLPETTSLVSGIDSVLGVATNPKVSLGFLALSAILRLPELFSVLWSAGYINKLLCVTAFVTSMYAIFSTFSALKIIKEEKLLDPLIKGRKKSKKRK